MNYTLEIIKKMSNEELRTARDYLVHFPCGKFDCSRCPLAYAVWGEVEGYTGCLSSDVQVQLARNTKETFTIIR